MLTRVGGTAARFLVSLLGATWRVQADGREHLEGLRRERRPFVFALWHRHLLPLVWYHRGDSTSLLVSGHEDGSYLAHAAQGWGYGLVRGSSTRGGVAAFRDMLEVLRRGGEMAVTPDGPRGPAGTVKLGIVAAAQAASAAIVPVAAEASSSWRLRSWDGFGIPKPFARVRIVYGTPLRISAEASRSAAAQLLQRQLETVTESARC